MTMPMITERITKALRTWRCTLGYRLLGRDFSSFLAALWLIRERAMKAVNEDGRVTLGECGPLADILYQPTPGVWQVTVSRVAGEAGAQNQAAPLPQSAVEKPSLPDLRRP